MTKYQVNYCEHLHGQAVIEADSAEEAETKMKEKLCNDDYEVGYAKSEISEVKEIK